MLLGFDFDGTLHPMNRADGFLSCRPRFEAVLRDYPSVELLATMAYRTDHSLDQIRALFSDDIAARIVGATPNRYIEHGNEPYQREREIMQWLRDEGREYEPWLALDDADWLFPPRCANLVLVNPDTGFTNVEEIRLRHFLQKWKVLL